jgi:hypothetical protein
MMTRHTPTILFVLGLSGLASAVLTAGRGQAGGGASTLPLVQAAQLTYVGGFRLPAGNFGSTYGFSYGKGPLAYDPSTNALFVGGHPYEPGKIAQVSIPTPVNNASAAQLPFAQVRQNFVDITEGHWSQLSSGQTAYVGGLLVSNGTLYGTGYIFYDANSSQTVSHFSHSTTLSTSSFRGFTQLTGTPQAGYVSGWMTSLSDPWKTSLGAPALSGNCCLSIIGRTSLGPDAFAFDPARIDNGASIPATPLVYYSLAHPTLGQWSGSNSVYGGTTQIGGMAAIAGTRSVLYFGRNGTGAFCYGEGTGNQALAGKPTPDGTIYCYDPTSSDKGQHAYPYTSQVWAYDLNDLVAVKNGSKQPWEVVPYATWPLRLPVDTGSNQLSSVAYDSARQLLYLVQPGADPDGYNNRPLIQVFQVAITAPAPTRPEAPKNVRAVVNPPSSASASQAVAAGAVLVDFDSPAPPPPSGSWLSSFGGIAWGDHQWKWWSASPGLDGTNHVDFGAAGVTSRQFTFAAAPAMLETITFVSLRPGTVTVTDDRGQSRTATLVPGQAVVMLLGWATASTTVTVSSALGSDMAVTALTYR